MQIFNEPYSIIDWDNIPIEKQSGEKGFVWTRTFKTESIRIVLAEYSPDFKADHWCCRGHVRHLLDGEMSIELKDGSVIRLIKGMSCCFSDNNSIAHKPFTDKGPFLLVID